jgi:uncharacterized protein involved in tellurium resistance
MTEVRSDFNILFHKDIIFVVDLDLGRMSVTNDAERVTSFVVERHGNHRVIYKDSMGNWHELLHDNGTFIDFGYLTVEELENLNIEEVEELFSL